MTKRTIIIEPDPILRKKSDAIEKVDDELRKLMDEMLETMYEAPGIGLAAVQIGILKRLIVIDITKNDEKKDPLFLINPEIISKSSNTSTYEEGCLSLPGYFAEIERPKKISLKYLDDENKIIVRDVEGVEARILQHEIDHLSGKLFVDYLSLLKRNIMIKKVKKYLKNKD